MADAPNLNPGPENERGVEPQATQAVIESEDLRPLYANFARVAGLPEELVVDFGLNSQPLGTSNVPVKVSQRVVINYFTAKRLFMALGAFLQRHEQAFGEIQIDINKRVIPQRAAK